VIVGCPVELAIISLLCQGHLLIEDVPGVGKTVLARSIAKSLGCIFSRIQFTPDMLPSDVTGVSIYNQVSTQFEFRPGPIMAQIVLLTKWPATKNSVCRNVEDAVQWMGGLISRNMVLASTLNMKEPFLPKRQITWFD
jgi:MoxR-like ATPase